MDSEEAGDSFGNESSSLLHTLADSHPREYERESLRLLRAESFIPDPNAQFINAK